MSAYAQGLTQSEARLDGTRSQERSRNLWGSWSFGLAGQTTSDATDSETYAGARLNLRGGYQLLDQLKLNSDFSLVAANGFSQARFGRDSLNSGININEALLTVNDQGLIQLDAGIINQKHLNAPVLVSNLPFPGLRQTIQWKNDYTSLGVKAQQTIPSSRTLDSQKRNEKEKTPTFFTETAFVEFYPTLHTTANLAYTRYRFNDLPTTVANNGRLLGNSVPFSTAAQSEFLFPFQGDLYQAGLSYDLTDDMVLSLNGQMIENRKAPSAFNRGFLVEAGFSFPILSQVMGLYVANFFNESDTSPGQYNSSRIGHNNMKGNSYGMSLVINKLFKVQVQYTDSDVINTNLVNSRRQNLSLTLETVYADF
jgi:hypothetical protein